VTDNQDTGERKDARWYQERFLKKLWDPSSLESCMSRLNSPGTVVVKPTNNVYTALAFISMIATLGALAFTLYRMYGGAL